MMSILYSTYTYYFFASCSRVADFFFSSHSVSHSCSLYFFLQTSEERDQKKLYDIVVNTACIRYIIYGFSVLFCFVQNGKHAEKRLHTHTHTHDQQKTERERNCSTEHSRPKYREIVVWNGRKWDREKRWKEQKHWNTFAIYIKHSFAHTHTHTWKFCGEFCLWSFNIDGSLCYVCCFLSTPLEMCEKEKWTSFENRDMLVMYSLNAVSVRYTLHECVCVCRLLSIVVVFERKKRKRSKIVRACVKVAWWSLKAFFVCVCTKR